jgi:hypothetical protein
MELIGSVDRFLNCGNMVIKMLFNDGAAGLLITRNGCGDARR